jgi:hypothetical protein
MEIKKGGSHKASVTNLIARACIIASIIYILTTLAAYLTYPLPFSPINNWLSDLGNPLNNPRGAVVYNIGCIIVSLILIPYFWQLRVLLTGKRKTDIPLMIAIISGILSSVFLIVTASFPLGTHTDIHSSFSGVHFISVDFFLSFTAVAFWLDPRKPRWLAILGYVISIINLITMCIFRIFFGEWITVISFIVYIILVQVILVDRLHRHF